MKKKPKNDSNHVARMELKYCEHCGSLWVRPSGAEEIYCEKCQSKVAELPAPKKMSGRIQLPVARPAMVERYGEEDEEYVDIDSNDLEFEAAGGVA
jgi:hypothetical protein